MALTPYPTGVTGGPSAAPAADKVYDVSKLG